MNDYNSVEIQTKTHSNLNLSDQTTFRLNEINKIKDHFHSEIQESKTMSKKLSKYFAAFDYIDKTLSATSAGISTISFTTVAGIPAGLASASFTLIFSLTKGIIKKLLKVTRKKKKKHNNIVTFAKRKLNSIETLMSQTLIDLDISHEEFKTIVNETEKYEKMKESIRNTKISDKLRKNSINIRKNNGNAYT